MSSPLAQPAAVARWKKVLRRCGLGILVLTAAWIALAAYPQPLFAYNLRHANVVLYARRPLPPQAGAVLADVAERLSRSPLFDPAVTHNVFLCDTPWLFTLFAPDARNVGAVSHTHLWRHSFIRPADLSQGRIIRPSGRVTPGERNLTYFITHEVVHSMTSHRVGRWNYARLSAFQQEGYADYVAFGQHRPHEQAGRAAAAVIEAHRIDFAEGRAAIRRQAPEMDTSRSGLYRRQELLVAYLLERRGMTVDQLVAAPLDRRAVERQLLEDESF